MKHPGIFDPTSMSSLGRLAEPACFTHALDLLDVEPAFLVHQLKTMILIRACEEKLGELVQSGEVRCPCHLGIGQEAVAVGVSAVIRSGDKIFGGHRSHSHFIALGGSVDKLLCETLGKYRGCSLGMGGSMHLIDQSIGFAGSVPIVAATIPIAVGAAMALRMSKTQNIAVSYFGDGSTEEGVFHESLNLAAIQKAPVLFVCENNLYSSHLDIKLRQPSDIISRFAIAHRIPALTVDGNDVVAVQKAAAELTAVCRRGEGPVFLETVTYRWRGHVGPREDMDVGIRRSAEDLAAWKKRDPIKRLRHALELSSVLSEQDFSDVWQECRKEVDAAIESARRAPYPPAFKLLEAVFAAEAR